MTLQQCKYVIKISEVGSFSEAARRLFIAQSGLSSSIKLLEEELGIRIFERSKGGVRLTVSGAEFVSYAERLIAEEEFIRERYLSGENTERLRVSTQHYDFIADVFCRFADERAGDKYDISLEEKKTHEVIHDVEVGVSDIGVIAIKNKDVDAMMRYLQAKDIEFTEFLKTPPHLFVKSTHPLAKMDKASYGDLASFPYVSYDQGEFSGSSLFTEEMSEGAPSGKHITISDRATLMNMLLKTDAYTVGTGIMPSDLNDGKIVSIPIITDESYRVGYITSRTRVVGRMASRFIDMLNEYCESIEKQ